MKSLLIGTLSLAMTMPALAGTPTLSSAASEKFGQTARLNYTAVRSGAYRGGYRPGYGYRGGYRGGYYGRYRYPYYGYRYPYYGYPYAAAFAFGVGLPLAYSAGYYAGSDPYYGYYGGYQQPVYQGRIVTDSAPGNYAPSTANTAARSVQTALQARGFYNGALDGEFGPQSQQALAQFQQANGLKVTGLINSSSLKALNLR
jgi:hypothetical protein